MRIDLHTHSSVSDGTDTPTELIHNAVAAGLDVVALCDHDTFGGIAEATAAAAAAGIDFVPGIEISCDYEGKGVHLLGYGCEMTYQPLLVELEKVREGRRERLPRTLALLAELGVPVTMDEVLDQAGDAPSVGRPHIADALVARGHVADRTEAFNRFLADDGPAYVHRYATDLLTGIDLVHAAGGATVIAHAWGRASKSVLSEAVLTHLVREIGLDGFEVDHNDHDTAARAGLRTLARSLGVIGLGSSDYHGTGKKDHPLGANLTTEADYRRLQSAMSRRQHHRH